MYFRTAQVLQEVWRRFARESFTQRFMTDLQTLEEDLKNGEDKIRESQDLYREREK